MSIKQSERIGPPFLGWAQSCFPYGAGAMYDCDRYRALHGAHGLRHQGWLWRGRHARARQGGSSGRRHAPGARQARGPVLALGAAWLCVVTFSSLATHATVMTAISSIERTGT